MCFSTLPTRSAPTSAALVKIPPPTRMNIASSAAPNPKPSSTLGAFALYRITTSAAPNRPRPTVNMPATPPLRKAIRMAGRSPAQPSRGAAATPTLPRPHSGIPPDGRGFGGQQQQYAEARDPEDADRPKLTPQVARAALLGRQSNLLHLFRA